MLSQALLNSLYNMAIADAKGKKSEARRSVYIIEVRPIDPNCTFDFYVGSTWHPVKYRFEQHREGGSKAAQIFRNRAKPSGLRWDLMEGFPKFHNKDAVERAEKRVADYLARKGYKVNCNMLTKKKPKDRNE